MCKRANNEPENKNLFIEMHAVNGDDNHNDQAIRTYTHTQTITCVLIETVCAYILFCIFR